MNTSPIDRRNNAEAGQSLVEVAIGMIVLLVIFSGLVDFGRAYFAYIAIEDAANEGATFLSIRPGCQEAVSDGSDTGCDDPNNAFFRAQNASSGDINWDNAEITVSRSGFAVGDPVTVTITYRLPLVTPFLPPILGTNHITLTSTASHIIITEKVN
ncbi:MAG: pilus assembly protein [Chloroflexi bacterium]|nr:pilus assembly protein [Chloroflexota bacterium]